MKCIKLNNTKIYFFISLFILLGLFFIFFNKFLIKDKYLLSNESVKNKIKNNEFDIIIDVRTKEEYIEGHYNGSINIPLQSFSKQLNLFQTLNKNSKILVYCRTGRRAKEAKQLLNKYGFNNVYYIINNYQTLL